MTKQDLNKKVEILYKNILLLQLVNAGHNSMSKKQVEYNAFVYNLAYEVLEQAVKASKWNLFQAVSFKIEDLLGSNFVAVNKQDYNAIVKQKIEFQVRWKNLKRGNKSFFEKYRANHLMAIEEIEKRCIRNLSW